MSETLVFLPWLRLEKPIELCDLIFCPIGEKIGYADLPERVIDQAKLISSSYTDRAGHPIPDFTIVLRRQGNDSHNLTSTEFSQAREYASLLFFCAWSLNEYYCQLGDYCNSSFFNVVGQRFVANDPEGICLTLRRRDGETLCGGFRHGQVRFVCPSQYAINRRTSVDLNLLSSLLNAKTHGSKIYDRLVSILGLLELANTDNDYMSFSSEIILMGSAYETFLDVKGKGKSKAFELSELFASTFKPYDTKTTQDAINNGRSIYINPKGAQPSWSVLQSWSHEIYQLRNDHVHSQSTPNRTWGWEELEHLIAAAFSFPLVVKVKLSEELFYTLTNRDKQLCYALPELLSIVGWNQPPYEFNNNWKKAISDASWSMTREQLVQMLANES